MSTGCGLVDSRSVFRNSANLAYRFNVEVVTRMSSSGVDEDARCTCPSKQRYGGLEMFEADRTLGTHRWPVVRLRGGSQAEVVLLSTRFFCLTTHWSKITFPCCGDDCRVCELLPARGLFYLAVGCNSQVSLLELASQSSSYFEQHAKFMGGGMIVGQVFTVSRRTDKAPVRSELIRMQEKCSEVPQLELARRVMALYKFPCPNPGEDLGKYEMRCRAVARIRCDRAADLLSSARDRQVNQ